MNKPNRRIEERGPALFAKFQTEVDIVQFDWQMYRVKSADFLEFPSLHGKAGAGHGRDFVRL
jgi:hypothetical protein